MERLKFILQDKNGVQTTLTHAPIGWDSNFFEISRSLEYWGYFNEYSIEVKFVKEGAYYLRDAFYSFAPGDKYSLIIQQLHPISLNYVAYKVFDVDLLSFEDSHKDVKVLLTYMELSRILKTNKSKQFEFDMPSSTRGFYKDNTWRNMLLNTVGEVGQMLLETMTDGGVTGGQYNIHIDSSLYTEPDGQLFLTTGKSIIDNVGTGVNRFKTSFNDLFNALNFNRSCGLYFGLVGTVQYIYIMPLANLFNTNIIYHADKINNFKFSVATDLASSGIKLGYAFQKNESGYNYYRGEINGAIEYGYKLGYTSKVYDMVSPYRADFIGFTYARAQEANQDDIFWAHCEYDAPDWEVIIGDMAKTYGGFHQDTFNLNLTPKRCAMRNAKFINSVIINADEIVFFKGDYESAFNMSKNPSEGAYIYEMTDIIIDKGNALFQPYIFEVDAQLPYDFYGLYNANPWGVVSFDYNDQVLYGHILTAKIAPAGRSKATLKLLASTNNDLTNLIRY